MQGKPGFLGYFSTIKEKRNKVKLQHSLEELFLVALCAVISGAQDWVAVSAYGKAKLQFLRKYLPFKHGSASHDTFTEVFAALCPTEFENCFTNWTRSLVGIIDGVIAIDGKTVRRSHDKSGNRNAIHMISAWASQQEIVLGQLKVDSKSNEITAIPKLLALLDISGCIVTIDAMGCQKKIAEAIIEKEADYVLALKGNQSSLNTAVEKFFSYHKSQNFKTKYEFDIAEATDAGHGRIEVRKCYTSDDISWLKYDHNWAGLKTVIMIESTRIIGEITTTEQRFYISSLKADAAKFNNIIRSHWGVENKLHWCLDVIFNEDQSRVRKDNGAENFSILRRIALNILRKHKSKGSLNIKRHTAGWNDDYMVSLLSNSE